MPRDWRMYEGTQRRTQWNRKRRQEKKAQERKQPRQGRML